jgi:hypothetical protein
MQTAKTAPKEQKTTTRKAQTKATQAQKEEARQKVKAIFDNSAESRIKKAKQFNFLAEKYEILKGKKDELDNFLLSSDGTKETIFLENAKGMRFTVTNSQVIEKVVELLTDQLSTFIEKSEEEIQIFPI